MNKETIHHSRDAAYSTSEGCDLFLLASTLCPFLIVPGLFISGAGRAHAASANEADSKLHADSEDEADGIANRWNRTRSSDERTLDVTVESDDGAKITYHYSVEDD